MFEYVSSAPSIIRSPGLLRVVPERLYQESSENFNTVTIIRRLSGEIISIHDGHLPEYWYPFLDPTDQIIPLFAVDTVVYLTSGVSYTVPLDWSNTSNTIKAWGGGQASTATTGGKGGGYASISNTALTAGASIAISIGSGGNSSGESGGNTQFRDSSTLLANGGNSATARVGTVKYAGGSGGNSRGGGGGAAGPDGAGANGGNGEVRIYSF